MGSADAGVRVPWLAPRGGAYTTGPISTVWPCVVGELLTERFQLVNDGVGSSGFMASSGESSHRRGAVYPGDMPLNQGSLGAHRDCVCYE